MEYLYNLNSKSKTVKFFKWARDFGFDKLAEIIRK
jgi:hypothetical protein